MADIVFANNASALLAASIADTDLSIQVDAGFGVLFPSPSGGQYFLATLEDNAGNIEVVQCTSRTDDILTVVRAQEGTTAKAFTLNVTRVELRLTKSILEEFAQVSGFSMTGDADFNSNSLIDAFINGAATRFTGGQIAGVPLRGAIDLTSNELAIPAGGGRATVGGIALLATGDDLMAELDTAGVIVFDSATVGVRVIGGAYLRVEGATPANHMEVVHDDTDVAFVFANTTQVTWDTDLVMGADLKMAGNEIQFASLVDFSLKKQTVSGIATTAIDYELGSYVILNLTANIAALSVTNPPAVDVGVVRLKIIQDATPRTITWPASVQWPSGVEPTLSVAAGAIDFVDIWTDDGGTTWYGASNTNWS